MSKKVKKIILVSVMVVLALGGSFLVSMLDDREVQKNKDFIQITADQYFELMNADSKSFVYIGRPTCGACTSFNPIIQNYMNRTGLDVHYLNTDSLTQDEFASIDASITTYITDESWGTPLLLIVGEEKIIMYNVGYLEYEQLDDFVAVAGLLDE